MYANESLGMLGFRAFDIVRERDFFHAAAAILVGVFGVMGVSCSSSLFESGVEAKGSDVRNEFFALVTMFEKLESLLALRGGREVREWLEWCISGVEWVEMERRRVDKG